MREDQGRLLGATQAVRMRESPHFHLLFPADSYAHRTLPQLVERLEAIYAATVEAFGLTDLPTEHITVLLSEQAPQTGARPSADAGKPRVGRWSLHAVYRSDAPGSGLESAIVELLLTTALRVDPEPVAGLLQGAAGYVAMHAGLLSRAELAGATAEAAAAPADLEPLLASPPPAPAPAARAPGRSATTTTTMMAIAPAHLAGGPATLSGQTIIAPSPFQPEGGEGASPYHPPLLLTAFVTFVIERYGAERFMQWVRRAGSGGLAAAAQAAYGKSLANLQKEWIASAQTVGGPTLSLLSFLKLSLRYLQPYWLQEAAILLTLLLTLAFSTVLPLSYTVLIDQAIVPGDRGLLTLVLAGLTAFFVVQSLASLAEAYLTAKVSTDVMNDMRQEIFTHLQQLPMGFHTRAQVGDLMSLLSNDLFSVEIALTRVLTMGLYLLLSFISSAVLLVVLEWRLAMLAFVGLPLFIIGPKIFGPKAAQASYERAEDSAQLASVIQENLGAQAVVKAFGLRESALALFRAHMERLASSTIRGTFLGSLLGTTVSLSASFVQLLALGVGAFMVINGQLQLGVLMAFLGLLGNVIAPLQSLSQITQALQQATGAMQRILDLLHTPTQIEDAPTAQRLRRPRGDLQLDHVSFSYTPEQLTLDNISLHIGAGESVAFVGPSGCGKSTVLNLLLRFYDPTSGTVSIDGHDLRTLTQESLRETIAVVFQDTFLFNVSIRDNIRLGRLDATDEEVEEAARAAEIHDLIARLPQGYDTVVGERGSLLSGGQRQRLAIARAILRDPVVLLLDEATSALDPQTEAAINETLARLKTGRTTVSVTHRLASAVRADRIFVLDRGRLVEQGTHQQLLERHGVYAGLWEQQQGFIIGPTGQIAAIEAARLQAVPLFRNLDGILLAALAKRFITERFAAGDTIFQAGEPGTKLYVIVRGQVEVLAPGVSGRDQAMAVLADGDYFGEIALLEDVPRTATVRARAPTVALTLSRDQLLAMVDEVPELRAAFEEVINARRDATVVAWGANA